MDALNDVAGALAAVRTKAGGLCERALYILTAEPQIKKTDLRQVLTCKMDKVELIVAHALETLAIYRAECEVERLRWNRRPFVP
jgi:lambda repressor-like predicted transcriptional regulator